MDASPPTIRCVWATPVDGPLARLHPTASGAVESVLLVLEADHGLTGHALGENLWGPGSHDLTKCLSAGTSDFVMLDVMKIGGITGWLRAASQAETAGLPVSSPHRIG